MKTLRLLAGFLIAVITAHAEPADWTMLVYVQANNNLSGFAMKNFSDMASVGSSDKFHSLVQWYQANQKGIWRYRVEKGRMTLDECHQVESDGTTSADLVDSMRWAANKYPANHYSLVLWNHGIGIIDPVWGRVQPWQVHQPRLSFSQDIVRDNPRIQLDGITTFTTQQNQNMEQFALTSTNTSNLLDLVTTSTRGILFNEHSRTYMDNQSLTNALKDIKQSVLKGKKLDLLGMDACLMAMVEVGYLARDYAEVMVASQEVELAQGWNYRSLMSLMSIKDAHPHHIARGIVSAYETEYRDKIPFYTQSAIDLNGMKTLTQGLDIMIGHFRTCKNVDPQGISEIAKKARRSCLQFSSASYIDLHSFLSEWHRMTTEVPHNSGAFKSRSFDQLQKSITTCMKLVDQYVIASASGKHHARARGLSVYFPMGRIDESYPKTSFAQECQWYSFIKELNS